MERPTIEVGLVTVICRLARLRGFLSCAVRTSGRRLLRSTCANFGLLLVLPLHSDLNPFGLGESRLRNMNGQHPMFEIGLDLVFVCALWQLEGAHECAVSALDHLIALIALFSFSCLFASYRQNAVLGHDLNIVRPDARQLGLEPDFGLVLLDVHRRREAASVTRESVFEQPVDLAPEPENRGSRRHPVKHFVSCCKGWICTAGRRMAARSPLFLCHFGKLFCHFERGNGQSCRAPLEWGGAARRFPLTCLMSQL